MTTNTTPGSRQKSTNVRAIPLPVKLTFAGLRAVEAASPKLAARLAGAVWTQPRRHGRPPREDAALSQAERLTIPFGLGGLSAWRWGQGPAVLLIHGWEGRGAQLSAFIEPLVAAGLSVVTWDAPAHGESHGHKASLVTFADAIAAAVRHVGPVHGAVAHSMGAASALYALTGGLDLGLLTLIAPADASLAIERFTAFAGLGPQVRDRMEAALARRYGASLLDLGAERLAQRGSGPLLVVHDHEDSIVPVDDGLKIAAAWTGAQLSITEGLGHHRILRDPAVINRVTAFLTDPLPADLRDAG